MCVEEYVAAGGVEGLIKLSCYATRLNAAIADKKAAALPEKAEAFQNAGGKALELGAAVFERNAIEMSNLWRHECAKALCVRDDGDDQSAVCQ